MAESIDPALEPASADWKSGLGRWLLVALILSLLVRAFMIEPFRIPSGSMIPTLLVGDYLLVNKHTYGARLPLSRWLVYRADPPERGDVIVFRYPDDPAQDYIKRVIGLPGDVVRIRAGRVEINGALLDRIPEGEFLYRDYERGHPVTAERFIERTPEGVEYTILQDQTQRDHVEDRGPWDVPPHAYFVMGDNRDNSRDSRMWRNPFVSESEIKGRAVMLHWSWVVSSDLAERGFWAGAIHTLYRVLTLQVEEIRWQRVGRWVAGLAD